MMYECPRPPDTSVSKSGFATDELELVWLAMPWPRPCPPNVGEKVVVT